MIPLEEIRLRLAEPPAADNELLEDLEARAVRHIEQRTGHYFGAAAEDTDVVVLGSGGPELYLPQRMSAVSAVASRAYLGGTETTIATDASDGWVLQLETGQTWGRRLLRRGGGWWDRSLEYVITGTIGYAAGFEPEDVRGAVLDLIALWYDPETETADELRKNVEAVINSRRRMPV